MMPTQVEVRHGSAYDVLLEAAAVADPRWRETFEAGIATHERILAVAGAEFVTRVAAFGRFGWINLVGLLAGQPTSRAHSLDRLCAAVRSAEPEQVHLVSLGGERRQLVAAVGQPALRALVKGDTSARRVIDRALAGDELVIEISPWLRSAASAEVRAEFLDLLGLWRRDLLPKMAERERETSLRAAAKTARSRLKLITGAAFLELIVPGLHYAPTGLERVVAVSTPQVAPVVVVVDGLDQTVVLHPPLRDVARSEPDRLLELARAVGDRTRVRLLTLLQPGEQTAVDLAAAMGAPRTTLLHHLAILRAAGLIQTTVTPGGATSYRLRREGFAELSRVAGAFIPTR